MKRMILVPVLFVLVANAAMAQIEKVETKEEALKGTHQFLVMIGHSHLQQGVKNNGKVGWTIVPSTGFDYNYWVSNHWALGLHNDLIIENFEVEDEEHAVIKRSSPFSSVVTGIFKPGKHINYL